MSVIFNIMNMYNDYMYDSFRYIGLLIVVLVAYGSVDEHMKI